MSSSTENKKDYNYDRLQSTAAVSLYKINVLASSTVTSSSDTTTPPPPPPLFPRIVSSSMGAMVTALAVTPLDVVKFRQQAMMSSQAATSKCPDCGAFILNNGLMECVVSKERFMSSLFGTSASGSSSSRSVQSSAAATESVVVRNGGASVGTFGLLRQIFAREGFRGIYAGLAPTLVMSVPNTVLYFTAYDEISSRLKQRFSPTTSSSPSSNNGAPHNSGWDHTVIPLVGGSSARILATVVTSPLELIRTRRALAHNPHSLSSELTHLIQTEGVTSLYKGLGPTLWRDAPFSAIYWLCLEDFKRRLASTPALGGQNGDNEDWEPLSATVTTIHAFISGAAAGMIAAAFTTPFDVVKTRQQAATLQSTVESVARAEACDHGGALEYRLQVSPKGGVVTQLKEIARREGVMGLWRGNVTRMIKVAPACAIMISCYELGKRVLVTETI